MTARRWSRRAVLAALAAGGSLVALGGGMIAWRRFGRPLRPPPEALIARILQRRAPYAPLDPATVRRFAADFMAHEGGAVWDARRHLHTPHVYGSFAQRWLVGAAGTAAIERAEREVVTAALLSTGFFDAKPYGSRPLVYRGWPLACANPFATLGGGRRGASGNPI